MTKKNNIKTNYFITCDYASFSEDGKVNILGVFKNIVASKESKKMPVIHPLFFIVGDFVFNKNGNYSLKVNILNMKKKDIIFENTQKMQIKIPKNKKNADLRLMIKVENLLIKEVGEYNLNFFVDGDKIASNSLTLSKK